MSRTISQRELRNESAAAMDAIEAGETLVITRNGTPVAEPRPIRRRRFVVRSARVTRLISVGADFEAEPSGEEALRAFNTHVGLAVALGRKPRPRKNGLMIAATAVAPDVPLFTSNVDDFRGLELILRVVPV